MGWEVFHQVILIPTRLTELTSKRKGNCNVMITRLVSHGLHVILPRDLIRDLSTSPFTASAMNSSLHRRIVATTLSLSYRLGHQSALAPSGAKVLRVADYLQTNAFPDLVIVGQEEYPHVLQRKAIRKVTSKVVRGTVGWTRPTLTLGTPTSASIIHHTTR